MSTPRVPESKVVLIERECVCGQIHKVPAATPWLELREKDGYIFSHSPKWKGVAVAILPFRKIIDPAWGAANTKYEFLAVMESRPSHGGDEYISSLTGAYDNSGKYTLEQCALNELEEEGGYDGWNNKSITSLGWVNGSKSSDGIDHLFAIELTPEDEQREAKGDGSVHEANCRPVWVDATQIINSHDMILISMYTRLMNLKLLQVGE
jgi:8-oxo-dGTP pyrophosphatase MutT (NUDIX family)